MSGNNALDTSLDDARFANVAPMSDDWYHGHKVVAMPSSAFGGMSIREVVSSRNESEQQQANNSRPRRSNSLGRQPIRPGRDIIQDVYDRMGVSYTRGMNYNEATPPRNTATGGTSTGEFEDQPVPMGIQTTPSFSEVSDFSANSSNNLNNVANNIPTGGPPPPASRPSAGKIKDKFSGRYRAAAAMTRGTPDRGRRPADPALQNRGRATEPRGRTVDPRLEEPESEGRRRARSLSRGLSVQGRWPPVKVQVDQGGVPIVDNTPASKVPPNSIKNPPTAESGRNHIQPPPLPPPQQQQQQQQQPPPPPPPPHQQQQQQQQQQSQPPSSPTSNRPKSPLKRSHSFDARPQYGGAFRTPQSTAAAMHNAKMRTTPQTAPLQDMSGSGTIRDEKKDGDDRSATSDTSGQEEVSAPTPLPSIKDRISAFAGKSNTMPSQRNGRRNTYGGGGGSNNYIKSAAPPPPKVDIYNRGNDDMAGTTYYHPDDPNVYGGGEEGGTEVTVNEDFVQQQQNQLQAPPEPSSIPPSAAASAAADAAAKYMRPSQVAKQKAASRHSTGSVSRSSIANSYLSGIQSSTSTTSATSRSSYQQQQPMMDGCANININATEDTSGGGYNGPTGMSSSDGNSVGAASSQSYGDGGSIGRRGSWQKAGSYSNNNTPHKSNASNPNANNSGSGDNISMEMVERMVDERVQIQLREVEGRMEGLLRRWMDSMNNKITSRLDAMEKSIKDSLPRHEI